MPRICFEDGAVVKDEVYRRLERSRQWREASDLLSVLSCAMSRLLVRSYSVDFERLAALALRLRVRYHDLLACAQYRKSSVVFIQRQVRRFIHVKRYRRFKHLQTIVDRIRRYLAYIDTKKRIRQRRLQMMRAQDLRVESYKEAPASRELHYTDDCDVLVRLCRLDEVEAVVIVTYELDEEVSKYMVDLVGMLVRRPLQGRYTVTSIARLAAHMSSDIYYQALPLVGWPIVSSRPTPHQQVLAAHLQTVDLSHLSVHPAVDRERTAVCIYYLSAPSPARNEWYFPPGCRRWWSPLRRTCFMS